MSIAIAILGLAFLILIHEAGHFFVARAVGMRPRKFYLGFPPALVKTTRDGIEYGIGSIPLGGYVKIPGMHRPAPQDVDTFFGHVERENPIVVGPAERLKRTLEKGDFVAARQGLTELEESIPAQAKPAAARGLRELDDALSPDAYWRQRTWRRIAVIAAGPLTNLVFAVVVLTAVYMIGIPVDASRRVESVAANSPAAAAGLRSGDVVVAINGRSLATFKDVSKRIKSSKGAPLALAVERQGQIVRLRPERPTKPNGYYALGFRPAGLVYKHYGPVRSVGLAAGDTWDATKAIGSFVGHITNRQNRKQISTPVGIVNESSQAVKTGFTDFLGVLALLSLSLALLNLLPLLPLDGGHIAFSIVEGIRGRAVGRGVYERVSVVGIALVLLLYIVGISNDIGRLGGG